MVSEGFLLPYNRVAMQSHICSRVYHPDGLHDALIETHSREWQALVARRIVQSIPKGETSSTRCRRCNLVGEQSSINHLPTIGFLGKLGLI